MVVGSIWDAKKREKQSGNQISIETPFCDDLGIILGGIWGAKILQQSFFRRVLWEPPPPRGGGASAVGEAPGLCISYIFEENVSFRVGGVHLRKVAFMCTPKSIAY